MTIDADINIGERPTRELLGLKRLTVKLSQLYLDPNNPRFGENRNVPKSRIIELLEATQRKVEEIGIDDLIPKVRQYGFVPTDPVVVSRFSDDQFVVLEGNRRTATLRKLVQAHKDGDITLDEELLASMTEFEVLVYEGENPDIVWLVQGLRHMSGIKEWRPLQQAAFISKIEEQVQKRSSGPGRPPGIPTVAKAAGVPTATAYRLLYSYAAFNQACDDDEYGYVFKDPKEGHEKFSIFSEAVFRKSDLQTWLEWNKDTRHLDNITNFKKLLRWVSPSEEGGSPRIVRAEAVRDVLPGVLNDDELTRKFEDGIINLAQANAELSLRHIATLEPNLDTLRDKLKECLRVIDSLPFPQFARENRQAEFNELLNTLRQSLDNQIQHHNIE